MVHLNIEDPSEKYSLGNYTIFAGVTHPYFRVFKILKVTSQDGSKPIFLCYSGVNRFGKNNSFYQNANLFSWYSRDTVL